MLQAQLEILEQQNITVMTDEVNIPIKLEKSSVQEVAATKLEDEDEFFTKEFTLLNDED